MGQITADQSQQVMAALSTNVDWASIDFESLGLQEAAIRDAKEAGKQFAAFLRNRCRLMMENFFRETGELTLQIPALARPTLLELQAERPSIKEIIRDTSPECPITLKLGTVLRPEETKSINGPEYERRIRSLQDAGRILGWQHRRWLVEHQDESPVLKALLGTIYVDFSGIVVLLGGDDRRVPYAVSDDGRWRGRWRWVGGGFDPGGRLAVSASSNPPVSLS